MKLEGKIPPNDADIAWVELLQLSQDYGSACTVRALKITVGFDHDRRILRASAGRLRKAEDRFHWRLLCRLGTCARLCAQRALAPRTLGDFFHTSKTQAASEQEVRQLGCERGSQRASPSARLMILLKAANGCAPLKK